MPGASALSAEGLYPGTAGGLGEPGWAHHSQASAGLLYPGGRGGGASAGLWESGAGRTSGLPVHGSGQPAPGVAASLCDALEAEARRQGEELLRVEASRTARGFFERRGYQVLAAQLVPVDGEELENFRMAEKAGPDCFTRNKRIKQCGWGKLKLSGRNQLTQPMQISEKK